MWQPKEIIVNEKVKDDPVTKFFVSQCVAVPVQYVRSGNPKEVIKLSFGLWFSGKGLLKIVWTYLKFNLVALHVAHL